jgi:hypothetical protein|nr:MAG TPA: hypothetical protein [Caudoviricetes sp.]
MEVNTYCSYTFNLYRYEPYKVVNETFVHKLAKHTLLEGIFTYIGYVPSFVYDFNYASLLDYDVIVIVGTPSIWNYTKPMNDSLIYFQYIADFLNKPCVFIPIGSTISINQVKNKLTNKFQYINQPKKVRKVLESMGLTSDSKMCFMVGGISNLNSKYAKLIDKYMAKCKEF